MKTKNTVLEGILLYASIKKIQIDYKGRQVKAHRLKVASTIPMDIDLAWQKVQHSSLLEFVSEGKVTFKPTEGHFPKTWQEGATITTRMVINGFLSLGGLHTIYIEKIDSPQRTIQTREHDAFAKVWDHTIQLQEVDHTVFVYEDTIIIYGGIFTSLLSSLARKIFLHRHERWQLVAKPDSI